MSAAGYTQANRLIAIDTDLGEDVLLLRGFKMRDELGRPFTCELDLRSTTHDIKFEDIIGKNVTVRVQQSDGKTRYINGYIARFSQEGLASKDRINTYKATMVPWLWFLTRTADCRIFQKMKIPDVIKKIFEIHNFSDVDMQVKPADYEEREFVVQYRETAFNFISRLMEEEGIFYFWKHENGKHTMVIADKPAAHVAAPGYETVEYHQQEHKPGAAEHVWKWSREQSIQPGVFALRDFDFKAPTKLLDSNKKTIQQKHEQNAFEVFDFPGAYETKAHGDRYATVRIEELDAQHEICCAEGDVRGLTTGSRFKLKGYHTDGKDHEFIVTWAQYTAETDEFGAGNQSGAGKSPVMYKVEFDSIPSAVPFRTPRTTPRPIISGAQTAVVAGPDGEEIFTDEFGRVKVVFQWDRLPGGEDKKPDATSCWIRVSQSWAGAKFGTMFIPRVGQEVIVEFLEGDPDRPIITGRVYNNSPQCPVPYKLPDMKSISTMKSSVYKGGEGFNEIRFEDKKGEEQVFIHAEKQMDVRVKADCYEWIGNDRHLVVVNDQLEHIKHDRSEIVDNDHKELIKNDRNVKVTGKEAVEITKSKSLKVTDDVIEVFEKNQSTVVTENHYLKAKNIVIEATENITLKVTNDSFIAIEKDSITIKTKAMDVTTTEKGIDIKAMKDITLKSDTAGVSIAALKDVALEATANLTMKATAKASLQGTAGAEVKGLTADLKADTAVTVQGLMVKIN